jgi:hypothetical protein
MKRRGTAILLLTLATACGYRAGGLMEDLGVRRIAVQVVGNQSFRQRYEAPLTRRILEDLSVHSTVVPSTVDRADAVLEVEVRELSGQVLSEGGAAPIREGAILAQIDARLVARKDGKVLRQARISDRAEYRVPVGETLASAQDETVRDLARKVMLVLEDPGW